jgi:hypothetical protein
VFVPRATAPSRQRGLFALATLAMGSATVGCVGVPFALPPTQLTVATGVEKAPDGRMLAPIQVRAAVHPMQFAPQWTGREFDLGVGYMYDGTRAFKLHGGYAEGGAVLWKHVGRTSFQRLSLRGQVRVLKDPVQPLVGRGAAAIFALETGTFTDGPFSDVNARGGVLGYSYGETSIGVASELSYANVDRLESWALTFGLVVRVPTVAGFAFAWATEFLKK